MKMKKMMVLALAFILLFSLTACSVPVVDEEGDVRESTINDGEENDSDEENGDVSDEDINKKEDITLTEQVLIDNKYCSVKLTSIDPENMWGYTLKIRLENKSKDTTYMFSVESATINGVMCDPYFTTEVAAGKKANEDLDLSDSTLEENGVGTYTDIELTFRVYDTDDWDAKDVARETVHIYPCGEEKATKFERKGKKTDNVLVDNDKVTVIVTGYEEDEIWGYYVNMFLVNKTDKELMFSWDDVSVNGYMMDPYFSTTVLSGKCAFASASWSDDDWEDNDITEVDEIEFVLQVYDYEHWEIDDFVNKKVTLKP